MYYFIVNYSGGSGRGRKAWRDISGVLKERKIPFRAWRTKGPGHATRLAAMIVSRYGSQEAPVRLIVVGGDGTINEVLNGIPHFGRVYLGVVPTGSGNDFVRGNHLPKKRIPALLGILEADRPERVDLGIVSADGGSPRIFGISSGLGLDAEVCKKALQSKQKKLLNSFGLGKLTYLLLTVESLFTMHTVSGRVIYDGDMEQVLRMRRLIFLAGMNLCWEGGGVPMAPHADTGNGMIASCIADNIPKWLTFLELPVLVLGKQKWLRGFTLRSSRTLDIRLDEPAVLHIDGEYGGEVRRVHMEALPGKLRLLR